MAKGLIPPIVARLIGDTKDFDTKFSGSADVAGRSMGAIESRSSKMQNTVGPALAKTGLAVTGAGAVLLKMGTDSLQATAQLDTAIKNTGRSMSEFQPEIDNVSKRLIKLGFDDEAAARSLASLTTATGDPKKALGQMGLAADIAASKHISLESATDMLVKASMGSSKVFKQFGITLAAGATEAEKNAAMTELMRRVQGQAASQSDNFGGKLKSLKIQAENVAEAIGAKVGPALVVAGPLMSGLGGIVSSGLVPKLATGVMSLLGFGSSSAAAGATGASGGVAFSLGWLPVIALVAAIGVAAYLLWRNWDTVFAAVKKVALGAYHFIRDHLVQIAMVVFAPIAPLIYVATHWRELWDGIKNVVSGAAGFVGDKVGMIVGFVADIPKRIAGFATGMFDGITGAFKGVVNTIIGGYDFMLNRIVAGVNWAIKSFNKIPLVPNIGLHLDEVRLPRLAAGGRAVRGGLAMVGEAGAEVVRLNAGDSVHPISGRGGADAPIIVNVNGPVFGWNKREVAESLVDEIHGALKRKRTRTGDLGLAT